MTAKKPVKYSPRFFREPRPLHRRRLRALQDAQIYAYLEGLGTARSLAVWLMYKNGEHRDLPLLDYGVERIDAWEQSGGIDLVRRNYAATKLLRKFGGLRLNVDKAAVALEKTRACEATNAETNSRLREDVYWHCQPLYYQDLTLKVRRELLRILGPAPASLPFEDFAFTGGSTFGVTRENSSQLHKIQNSLDSTVAGVHMAMQAVNARPLWAQYLLGADGPASCLRAAFRLNDTEEIFTVPKDATTDRTCARFNVLTVALQRVAARHIINRLRRAGIDVTDQQPNQLLASFGASSGALGTLDLSSASDLISRGLVKLLFAPVQTGSGVSDDLVDFETRYLARLRAINLAWPDGSVTRAERYSAMGCGFTFELMTLILVAIMRACGSRACSAFGDDLVVESGLADKVADALAHYGLSVNQRKSFFSPYPGFRESCGEDYYKGDTVRVPHLDDKATSLSVLVAFQNRAAETAVRFGWHGFMDHMRFRVRNFYAREGLVVPYGPFNYGDGHLAVPFDVSCPRPAAILQRYAGWDGFMSRTYVQTTRSALAYRDDGDEIGFTEPEFKARSLNGKTATGISSWAVLIHALGRLPGNQLDDKATFSHYVNIFYPEDGSGLLESGCASVTLGEKCVDLIWLDDQSSPELPLGPLKPRWLSSVSHPT